MAGWPTRARAIATRWRCPPESWVGRAWGALGQADQLERVEGALAALLEGDAGVEEPVGDVVQHGGVLGQEELLEDEPDPGGPQVGHLVVGHRGHVQPGDPHPAAGGPVEGSHQLQQRGLARPRGADDPDQLPRADREVHPAQGLDGRLAGVALGHVVDFEHRHPAPPWRSRCRPRPRLVGRGWRVGHVAGTTTLWPAASPEPVTCTSPSASSNSPSETGTRWLVAACADDLDGVATAGPGQQRGHRHHQGVRHAGGGDPDLHRGLIPRARGGRVRRGDADGDGRCAAPRAA